MAGTTSAMVEHALEYARAGIPVVPLHGIREDGNCTCGRPDCPSPGKHPRTRRGLTEATTNETTIKRWWSSKQWPNASIAGVGGAHLCLDVDVKASGDKSLETLIQDNAPLPSTAVAETGEYDGKRGRHYWFKVPEDREVGSKVSIRNGIDIRCARAYAVLPPSPHASGVNYEWVTGIEDLAEAPDWLLDLAPEALDGTSNWEPNPHFRQAKDVREFLDGKYNPPPGEQRDFLVRAARSVLTTGKTVDEAALLLWEGNGGRGGICACSASRDPWTESEILFIVEDVFRKNPPSAMDKDFAAGDKYTWDDWGNAKRLIDVFEENSLFHVHEWGKWYIWDPETRGWIEDEGLMLRREWEALTRGLWDDAFGTDDKNWIRFLARCRNRASTENAVHFARDFRRVSPNDLNADPFLLNCQNGILNLKTGELLDSDPSYLLTKRVHAEYDPKARSSLWEKVLSELIPDEELRIFVQKVFGYCLTGSTEEHKFFYFHGPPGAGKTTLLEAFAYLMGNYAEACEPATFMLNRMEGGPSEDIARLSNARMVVTHEVEESARWAEAKIAHLTGGDKVTARFLHQNSFEFYPKFKIFFSANHRPKVSGSSQSGLWRRLVIVPIDRVIPEEDRDPMLLRKLRQPEALNALLAWAVDGTQMWLEDYNAGRLMEVPQVVKDEVEEYRTESDHVLQFVNDLLRLTDDTKDRVPKPDMYSLYRAWCEENGRKQYYTNNKFSREMRSNGLDYKAAQHEGRVRECWMGVKIKGPQVESGA